MKYTYTVSKTGKCFYYKVTDSGKKTRVSSSDVPQKVKELCRSNMSSAKRMSSKRTASSKKLTAAQMKRLETMKMSELREVAERNGITLPSKGDVYNRRMFQGSGKGGRVVKSDYIAILKDDLPRKKEYRGVTPKKKGRPKKSTPEKKAVQKRSQAALDESRYKKWVMYKKPGLSDSEIVEASDIFGTSEKVAEKLIRRYQRKELGVDAAKYRKWVKHGRISSPHEYSRKMGVRSLQAADSQIRKFNRYER